MDASYQLSAISYQLSAISYQLSAISYQLSAIQVRRIGPVGEDMVHKAFEHSGNLSMVPAQV
jgi:hypothetical protein